jgi:cytoskeletal protein CcmA (bactofilin family)
VWAEIRTPALVMEEGAFLEGTVTMEGSKGTAKDGAAVAAVAAPAAPSLRSSGNTR